MADPVLAQLFTLALLGFGAWVVVAVGLAIVERLR